jgi:hypothetical protein
VGLHRLDGDEHRGGHLLVGVATRDEAHHLALTLLYDVAAGGVADAAYPALALAVIGALLVVGARFGRPGGLIALGVVATIALLGTSVDDTGFEEQRVSHTPDAASGLESAYTFSAGAYHLDLTEVTDLDALDGRTLAVQGKAGEIVVTLPDGVDVDVDARLAGAGEIVVLGEQRSGLGVSVEQSVPGGDDVPAIDLELGLVVGKIEVRQ